MTVDPVRQRYGEQTADVSGSLPQRRPVRDTTDTARLHPSVVRIGLQKNAKGNLQRHLIREARRLVVLLMADLGAFAVMRTFVRAIRDVGVLGSGVTSVAEALAPRGILAGWQYAVALVIGLAATGNYGRGDQRRNPQRLFAACALATALPLWVTIWSRGVAPVLTQYAITTVLVWAGLLLERRVVDRLVSWTTHPSKIASRTVFVGHAADCRDSMTQPPFGGSPEFLAVGFVEAAVAPSPGALGSLPDLERCLHEAEAETVVLCGHLSDVRFQEIVDIALASGCHLLAVPRATVRVGVQPSAIWRNGQMLIELTRPTLRGRQFFLKRILDLALTSAALVILSPVFIAIALAVRLESRGPVLFGQLRLGQNGRRFRCLKFRSMHRDAEARLNADPALKRKYVANSYKLPEDEDPRLTKVGRFLRKTSLDELPQLLNVVKGDMSLVGPRPIVPQELEQYGAAAPVFLSLKPGITGAWQVDGRSLVGYPDRADMEVEYVRTWSLGRDLMILLRTVPAVALRRGAH